MGDSLTSDLGSIFRQPQEPDTPDSLPKQARRQFSHTAGGPKKKKKPRSAKAEAEAPVFRPGRVSSVKPQAKNAARVSVFIDDTFSFGCYKSVWQRYGVEKGEPLNEEQHEQLMDEEQRCKLQHYWMDLLSRRNHSAGELRRKALQKGYPEHHFEPLIDDFRTKNFIDERAFAMRLAEEMRERKRWGPRRIRAALLQKSIPGKFIDEALESTRPEDDFSQLKALVLKNQRRLAREDDPVKRKKKLFDYLARKGHQPAVIMQHIETLMKCVAESQE